jgi:serine/threonine-protein kinase
VNPQNDNASNALTDDLKVGPGSQIDGRYELVERLGTGGFGTVFKARHLQLDRPVAVKVLHPRLIEDPEAVKRFQQEAQAVSLLDHPNIIRVFSFGLAEKVVGSS